MIVGITAERMNVVSDNEVLFMIVTLDAEGNARIFSDRHKMYSRKNLKKNSAVFEIM